MCLSLWVSLFRCVSRCLSVCEGVFDGGVYVSLWVCFWVCVCLIVCLDVCLYQCVSMCVSMSVCLSVFVYWWGSAWVTEWKFGKGKIVVYRYHSLRTTPTNEQRLRFVILSVYYGIFFWKKTQPHQERNTSKSILKGHYRVLDIMAGAR